MEIYKVPKIDVDDDLSLEEIRIRQAAYLDGIIIGSKIRENGAMSFSLRFRYDPDSTSHFLTGVHFTLEVRDGQCFLRRTDEFDFEETRRGTKKLIPVRDPGCDDTFEIEIKESILEINGEILRDYADIYHITYVMLR